MKIIKKNQIMIYIAVLILMIAGYLNYSSNVEQQLSLETAMQMESKDDMQIADIGDATLVNSNDVEIQNNQESSTEKNGETQNSQESSTETNVEIQDSKKTSEETNVERDGNMQIQVNTGLDKEKVEQIDAGLNKEKVEQTNAGLGTERVGQTDTGLGTERVGQTDTGLEAEKVEQTNTRIDTKKNEQTSDNEYFIKSKLERETMYSQMLETYKNVLDSANSLETQRQSATEEIQKINNIKNSIMICENLIKTKGFENSVIFVNGNSINVIIGADELKTEQIAQIQNIVSREMNAQIENIHITNK